MPLKRLHHTVRGFLAAIPHGLPYSQEVQAERVGAWVKALEDLPGAALAEALTGLLRECRTVPSIAEVRAAARARLSEEAIAVENARYEIRLWVG
jgi:hypothetical protein